MNSISHEPRAAGPQTAGSQAALPPIADAASAEARSPDAPRELPEPEADGGHVHGARAERAAASAAELAAEPESGESPVNYDESALLELEIDGTDYRLDVGRAGTALCISTRSSGTWSWSFRGEAKWQNNLLRCKAFDRAVLAQLGTALAETANDAQS